MASVKKLLSVFRKYKYGIALSGGGVRGFAHIGVLKALNEAGIYPDVIAGVSAGAIVGAYYASGYTPDQMYEVFVENSFFKMFNLTFPKYGLLKVKGLEKTLLKNLKARTFEELKYPLFISTSQLNSGKLHYFSEGKLIKPILASASIPVLFIPVNINGKTYVDGGLHENLPVTPLIPLCKKIIGVHLNLNQEVKSFNNLIQIAERVFSLHALREVNKNKKVCNMFIEPPGLKQYGLLDVSKGKEMFEIGYDYTKYYLENLNAYQKMPNHPESKEIS